MSDEYHEVASFEVPAIEASGGGTDGVAFVTEGDVSYVEGANRYDHALEGSPIDVAVGSLVYVLTDDEVVALSPTNGRVWSVDVDGEGDALAALLEENVVCVLTATELVALDGETGASLWRRDRPYADVGSDTTFLGRHGRFHLATWSFVVSIAADGDRVLDTDLDSTVVAVDAMPETVVVALKNDRLVGIGAESGTADWRTEMGAGGITPGPNGRVVVRTADGLLAVDGAGEYEAVGVATAGDVQSTRGGTQLCVHRGATLSVYRRIVPPDDVTARVESDAIASNGVLAVRVGCRDDVGGVVRLSATATGATLANETKTVPVSAGESTTVAFDVDAVTDETASIDVETDAGVVTTASVRSDETRNGRSIRADLALESVDGDVVTAVLTVGNDGERPVSVSVGEDGIEIGSIDPGDTDTVRVNGPFVPGGRFERTVVDPTGESVATASLDLPDRAPTLSVATRVGDDYGFVDVTVGNRTDTPLEDELVVTGLGDCPPVERSITCRPGSSWTVAIALPPRVLATVADGTVVARIRGRDLVETADAAFADASIDGNRRRSGGGASGTAGQPPAESGSGEPAPSVEAAEAARPEPVATVRRSVSPETPLETEAFVEYLSLEIDRDLDDLLLATGERTHALSGLEAHRSVRLRRAHAVFDEAEIDLPEATVRNGGDVVGTADDRIVAVERGPLAVRGIVDPVETDRFRLSIENHSTEPIDVGRVRLEGVGVWEHERETIPPDEDRRFVHQIDGADRSLPDDCDAVPLGVEFARDGEWSRFRSLAFLANGREVGSDGVAGPLEVALGTDTSVAGDYGHLALEVTNAGSDPIRDLTFVADGAAVNETLYVEESVEELPPDETVEHYIDVNPGDVDDRMTITVTVDCTDRDEDVLTLAGPVALDESSWSDDDRSAWSLTWASDDGSSDAVDDVAIPRHLGTAFERTE